MKNLSKIISIFSIVFFLIASCTEVMDEKVENWDKKIVLHGYLYPDEPVRIYIHESKLYEPVAMSVQPSELDEDYPFTLIKDANVKLYEEGKHVASLTYVTDSVYYDVPESTGACYIAENFIPSVGKEYTIRIITKDHPRVEATTFIPGKPNIISFTSERTVKVWRTVPIEINRCILNFSDNPDQKNYYAFKKSHGEYSFKITDDPVIEYYPLFTDESFNGEQYELYIDATFSGGYNPVESDTIMGYLEFYEVTRDHYLYHKSFMQAVEEAHLPYLQDFYLPITEPVPIYTNVKNGLGIFTGLNYSEDSVRLIFHHHTNLVEDKK
jgi:hypothetical protein